MIAPPEIRFKGNASKLHKCRDKIVLYDGARGCVAGETLIGGERIDTLRPRSVQTLSGPVMSGVPFRKGYAPLYRVTLSSGVSCLATADHLFLSRAGWVRTDSIEPGTELLSESRAGDRHSTQTGAGSQDRYSTGCRRCDRRLQIARAAALVFAPSPADAPERSRADWQSDAQAYGSGHSRPYPAVGRRAKLDSALQPMSTGCTGSPSATSTLERDSDSSLSPELSLSGSLLRQPSERLYRDACSTLRSRVVQSCGHYGPQWDQVASVEWERDDFFYDLHIPGVEHYVGDGIYSHNTGKTMPAAWKFVIYALQNPGSRGLVIRKTRVSMSQTTLVTLENVLAQACPDALTGCRREQVHSYRIVGEDPNAEPSEIVVSGIDLESRQRSGEYSWIWIDEANEVTREDIESLLGCLRWPVRSYYQMLLTTNPDSDEHPLWKMFKEGKLTRIQSKHTDNPFVTDDYLHTLSLLTGVRKKRFLEGIWTSAEGQVLDQWDRDLNVIDCPETAEGDPDYDALHISWFFASVDWGLRVAGCMDIWGVCLDGSIVLVKECYYSQKTGGWWCDRLCELDRVFHLRAIVCDPSDPAAIMDFNTRLGYPAEGPDAIAWGATNKRGTMNMSDRAGLWQLCEMVAQRKLKVLRDCAHTGVDAEGKAFGPIDQHLRDAGLPTCSIEEVSGYVWMRDKNGHYIKDVTDPKVPDHGMDAWRYACMFARDRDLSDPPIIPKDDPESYGALYHHNALVAALKVAEEECVPFDDVYQEILEEQNAG